MASGKLTQTKVEHTFEPGMYGDGDGLYLQVASPTARSWIYRYTIQKRERWHGLGSVQTFTLAEARKLRDEVKITKVRRGIDPVGQRKNAEQQDVLTKARATPFRQRAEQYMEAHADSWRNSKHRDQWRSTLKAYVYPAIGDVAASAVTAGHVVEILRPIWADKPETARRVRGRIEAVLDYAADPDDPLYRNPAAMTAQLAKKLPKPAKDKASVNHPSLPYEEIGAFMASLQGREGMAARALEFVILTAARTGEGLGAQWSEVDLGSAVWTIPSARMKSERTHRVPLSPMAVEMLKRLKETAKGESVFPSPHGGAALSDASLLAVLRRLGRHEITVHGFRSTFRTWAAERTNFPREVCEAALAHVIKDKTEAAYQRGDMFEKRRRLMDAWAGYATIPVPGVTASTDIKFLATVTGRLGYAWNNWLWYVKGGWAYVDEDHSATVPGAVFTAGDSRGGWTVGTGFEWGLATNWSAKVEYNYMDFGDKNITLTNPVFGSAVVNVDQQIHAIKFGVNYRFGGYR